ncbi:hypothetical protein ACIOD1_12850 [Streptomyces sp. NPDC088097]|uniref:hypothetical protein n=1 Tax=Streptomyces sp. NPDC088097 TaxID=3365823 RepID=UPI0037F4E231
MTEQPSRHTVDTITSDALDQLYARIDTLEHVAERNKQAYKLVVRDVQAATQLLKEGKAALRQAKLDQLTDREAISYWTHQAQLARDYSAYDGRALASTILQAQRQAARADQAEAALDRLHQLHADRGGWCAECCAPDCENNEVAWPCPTIRALDNPQEPTP